MKVNIHMRLFFYCCFYKAKIDHAYFIFNLNKYQRLNILTLYYLAKIEKERSASRTHSGVKRSLYRRIRMEKKYDTINNIGQRESIIGREKPFNRDLLISQKNPNNCNVSVDHANIHRNDIKRLEEKIKELDREIKETENKRREVTRCHSISTHETELDEEIYSMKTPVPERKSMPSGGVKHTLGHIRGIITHMVDLVNKDPSADVNLSSELSDLVKMKAEIKSDKETPDVIKSIKTFIGKTPAMLDSMFSQDLCKETTVKKSQSKYEEKRLANHIPKRK